MADVAGVPNTCEPFNVSNWSPGHGRLKAVYGLCLRVRLVGHVCVSNWMSGGAWATGASGCRPVKGRGTCEAKCMRAQAASVPVVKTIVGLL